MLPHETLGSSGETLISFGRDSNGIISFRHALMRGYKEEKNVECEKSRKYCSKVWITFATWLRQKKVKIRKDFRDEF